MTPVYRILKSRRVDGDPYVLQRGAWSERSGRKTFKADWEKSFPTREDAHRHEQWLQQTARDVAELTEAG
jgi:hypothetical protein